MLQEAGIKEAIRLTVGAVAGVLLTPKFGSKNREKQSNSKQFPGKIKKTFENSLEKVDDIKTRLQQTKNKVSDDQKEQYIDWLLKRLSFLGYQSFQLKLIIFEALDVDNLKNISRLQYCKIIKSLEEYEYLGSIYLEFYSK